MKPWQQGIEIKKIETDISPTSTSHILCKVLDMHPYHTIKSQALDAAHIQAWKNAVKSSQKLIKLTQNYVRK